MIRQKKITIVGAGSTGSTAAWLMGQKELGDIILIDTPDPGLAKGRALDISQSNAILGIGTYVRAANDYCDTSDSDIVLITAGVARKPGMSRNDLININAEIMKNIIKNIVRYSPGCIIIVLSNPVDIMTYICFKESGLPKGRVLGQSGILDAARFQAFAAELLNISVNDISCLVIGEHCDQMIPLTRYSSVGGIPLMKFLSDDEVTALIERTKHGGGEIVNLVRDGSACYAPAAALTKMVDAILKNKRRIACAVVYLEGEYGYHDICLSIPVIIGRNGIERILKLKLNQKERSALDISAASVTNAIELIDAIL